MLTNHFLHKALINGVKTPGTRGRAPKGLKRQSRRGTRGRAPKQSP